MTQKQRTRLGNAVFYIGNTLVALIFVSPLIWMISSSLKPEAGIFKGLNSLRTFIPTGASLSNYLEVFQRIDMWKFICNSLFYVFVIVVLDLFINSICGYALAKFEFKGKNLIFIMIVAGMMISPEVNLVSLFKLMQKLKLYNTYLGLIISYSVFQFPFTVLLFRSYMLSLPKSVEEAAMLDGCSVIQMFTKIVLPMSKPILFSGALFATMHAWNEYMFATVFVESDKLKTVPVGLVSLQTALRTDYPVLIAGLTISAAVVVVVFLVFQKQFVRGLAQGGVKG